MSIINSFFVKFILCYLICIYKVLEPPSSINIANNNSPVESSCSNIASIIVLNDTIENIVDDNTSSSTENISDMPNTGKFK